MDKVYLGVPCSATDKQSLFPCTREDEAVAIAFGMKLCGVDNVEVFMQNSGFGVCLDVITSLLIPYKQNLFIEVLDGSDNPQHTCMNELWKEIWWLLWTGKNNPLYETN